VNGTWGSPIEVAGTASTAGGAGIVSMSCPAAGNCTAGGSFGFGSPSSIDGTQAFVVNEVNGAWGEAIEVPGFSGINTGNPALDSGGSAEVTSVSCPSVSTCNAFGDYTDSAGGYPFVATEN
jgi:hypothetical protein